MRCWRWISVGCLISVAFATGCAARKEAPRVYERQIKLSELAADVPTPKNAFQLRDFERTTGRFACSLAIAKFTWDESSDSIKFRRTSKMEEAAWVEATRGLSELTDLQFLDPIDTVPNPPTLEFLCGAARDLNTALLLVYIPNRFGPNSAQVLGVLYDSFTGRPLASLHTNAEYLDESGVESPPDELKGDHRQSDAYYQACRAYERLLVRCLGALIDQDAPSTETQPHRWTTPPDQRWWIPR